MTATASEQPRVAARVPAIEPAGTAQGVASVPEIAWAASLGIYLIVKGSQPSSPILTSTP